MLNSYQLFFILVFYQKYLLMQPVVGHRGAEDARGWERPEAARKTTPFQFAVA